MPLVLEWRSGTAKSRWVSERQSDRELLIASINSFLRSLLVSNGDFDDAEMTIECNFLRVNLLEMNVLSEYGETEGEFALKESFPARVVGEFTH